MGIYISDVYVTHHIDINDHKNQFILAQNILFYTEKKNVYKNIFLCGRMAINMLI